MKGRGDGLLVLVVVGRRQKTNGTDSFVLTIPMSHLGRKSCSAEASTIFASHLHSTTIESVGVILYPCPFLLYWCEPGLFAPAQCGSFVFLVIAGLYVK